MAKRPSRNAKMLSFKEPGGTLIKIDIARAANLMVEMFGNDAEIQAALRADQMLKQGDPDACREWIHVGTIIKDLRGPSRSVH